MIENPSLLVQVFQEADAKTRLDMQKIYYEKTCMEDKGTKSKQTGRAFIHNAGLTPVGGERERKIGSEKSRLQYSLREFQTSQWGVLKLRLPLKESCLVQDVHHSLSQVDSNLR